ncbi:threonine/serine exporter family protein [Alicyclobacillus tolerans]|uniref:threonine/serine exporter family protein n=1 Tax=Alicyclobacillus tolerans TaxID=90970 RepID=UPI001F1B2BDC|nr:threonine/serine exporter family protein [Alicyclobacillus tolerans]MCF8567264.1 threonine/serine exporter family protein [Alicyclobacillus tolerans]
MDDKSDEERLIMDVCLLAGKIMLQNGAETYRVEDTMIRMAKACHVSANSFVTPTGIIFSVDGVHKTNLIRVSERGIDLQKVTRVNTISRSFCSGSLTIQQAYDRLQEVESSPHAYPFWLQSVTAALASGCFLMMFNGAWSDFWAAFICGGMGFSLSLYFNRLTGVKFFAEFLASFAIGIAAFLSVKLGIGHFEDKIIIGSVMPLVPGLLITNAVRDLMAGHLVSGTSKGIEALLTALAIGGGIAATLPLV